MARGGIDKAHAGPVAVSEQLAVGFVLAAEAVGAQMGAFEACNGRSDQ